MKTKVVVTQDDIDNGVPKSARSCPIANALKRTDISPEGYLVEVAVPDVCVYNDEELVDVYDLPDEAVNFATLFDKGEKVEPFEFEL